MSFGELLLILIVALVVLGPKKLPLVAHHLGILVSRFSKYRQQAAVFWQQQLNEQKLQGNIKKAQAADSDYQQDHEV